MDDKFAAQLVVVAESRLELLVSNAFRRFDTETTGFDPFRDEGSGGIFGISMQLLASLGVHVVGAEIEVQGV